MTILIATGLFPPEIGGPATYSKLLTDELPKYGFEVKVLSFGPVRHLPKLIRHFVYFLKVLKQGSKSDIIFAQDPVSVGLPSALAAKILGKKFILKIVGDYAWEQYQINPVLNTGQSRIKYGTKFKNLEEFQREKYDLLTETRRKIQKWVAKKAKKIIVPSQYFKNILVNGWSVPSEKITVIYNAVEQPIVRERTPIGDKDFILSIGRLVPWKGFGTLIEIMPDLPKEMKLVIIGSGPQEESLKFKVKSLKLEERVQILGQVPHDQLVNYFAQAGIFVLNSGYEGLSHLILEAMQQGVPVITTDIGGNPELIKDGYNGILIEYNNKNQIKEAILKLWFDQDLQQKFIDNSLKELEKFSLDKMISQTIDVLIK